MVKTKSKKAQEPKRIPADKLLLDFVKDNRIVLIVDEVKVINPDVVDAVYVTIKRPRVRAFYLDQIKKGQANGEDKPKVDIVS
jgi:hypothetical protein